MFVQRFVKASVDQHFLILLLNHIQFDDNASQTPNVRREGQPNRKKKEAGTAGEGLSEPSDFSLHLTAYN